MSKLTKKLAAGVVAITIWAKPASADARTYNGAISMSPLVALSILGSNASRTALCASLRQQAAELARARNLPGSAPAQRCNPMVNGPGFRSENLEVLAEGRPYEQKRLTATILVGLPAFLAELSLNALLNSAYEARLPIGPH